MNTNSRLLVEHEQLSREQRKQARLVKQARLKLQATVQELEAVMTRQEVKQAQNPLSTCLVKFHQSSKKS